MRGKSGNLLSSPGKVLTGHLKRDTRYRLSCCVEHNWWANLAVEVSHSTRIADWLGHDPECEPEF